MQLIGFLELSNHFNLLHKLVQLITLIIDSVSRYFVKCFGVTTKLKSLVELNQAYSSVCNIARTILYL